MSGEYDSRIEYVCVLQERREGKEMIAGRRYIPVWPIGRPQGVREVDSMIGEAVKFAEKVGRLTGKPSQYVASRIWANGTRDTIVCTS